jgi:hypothetical protein
MRSLLFACLLFAAACNKPTESDCQKAIDNMTKILGGDPNQDVGKFVRECQAHSTKATVQCTIAAKTKDDLEKCQGPLVDEPKQGQKADEKKPDAKQ